MSQVTDGNISITRPRLFWVTITIAAAIITSAATILVATYVVNPSTAQAADVCNGQPATIQGTTGDDTKNGTANNDFIALLGGADESNGLAGDDSICGGPGDDILSGGDGVDMLFGQQGPDDVSGDVGNDTVSGGAGDDTLAGGADNDTVNGNAGDDDIDGGAGTDTCNGGPGTDTFTNCETQNQ